MYMDSHWIKSTRNRNRNRNSLLNAFRLKKKVKWQINRNEGLDFTKKKIARIQNGWGKSAPFSFTSMEKHTNSALIPPSCWNSKRDQNFSSFLFRRKALEIPRKKFKFDSFPMQLILFKLKKWTNGYYKIWLKARLFPCSYNWVH